MGEVAYEQGNAGKPDGFNGGDSGASQFNFAGIGTTGGGVAGVFILMSVQESGAQGAASEAHAKMRSIGTV